MPVDIDDRNGWTAPITAASFNQTDVVPYLLSNGANVNEQDRWGMTALHLASYNNYTDFMRILLQHGARKDIKDDAGNTPIDYARLFNKKKQLIYWNNFR